MQNIKRFYKHVETVKNDHGWSVLLDGRPVKSAARRLILLPNEVLSKALAAEWEKQEKIIVPASMPTMRFAAEATDGTLVNPQPARDEIVKYVGSDLLCYHAPSPSDLVRRQKQAWDPVLKLLERNRGWRFAVVAGVSYVEQKPAVLQAVERWLADIDGYRLAALHVVTALTGSALLAFALEAGWLSADDVWLLAHLDEDYQAEYWGLDMEAAERRAYRHQEYYVATLALQD